MLVVQMKPEDGKTLLEKIEADVIDRVLLEDNLKEAEAIDEALGRDEFHECRDLVLETKNTVHAYIVDILKEWLQSHGFDTE